ncbi:GNAT family N-acetyltransferase [Streptomyces sp. NPDC006976]|uniref:GNAT family N-acetyltransferase n=1 Tax=unclassified Streptomyces TaxID=2593676 RepID=UPI00037CB5E2|nr:MULTISPECIES: GNAT family N-acetyltransferase [unclassified Streptomyces]MYY06878.1 N-acetyltransferase [Streptomyces sp. SID4913]
MAEQTGPEIRDDRAAGKLLAYEDGGVAGTIAYFVMDGEPAALVAVHTVVESGHEGKGLAGALVAEFYAMAGREGVPVVPLCPYAAKWASRHPEQAPEAPAGLVERAKVQLASHPELY